MSDEPQYVSPFLRHGHNGPCGCLKVSQPRDLGPEPEMEASSREITKAIDYLVGLHHPDTDPGRHARIVLSWMDWATWQIETMREESNRLKDLKKK